MPSLTSGQVFFLIVIALVVFMIIALNLIAMIENRARIKAGAPAKKKRKPLVDLKYESTFTPEPRKPAAAPEDRTDAPG